MKAVIKRIAAEWEKSLLWVCAALLTLVIVFQISGLLGEHEAEPTRNKPTQARRSYLNEATAFAFLQPLEVPAPSARNPFAFSCKLPAEAAAKTADQRKVWRREKTPQPPPPAAPAAVAVKPPAPAAVVAPPAAPPAPKRAVTILYRGVYKGGDEAGRQLAFVSSQQTPGGAKGATVAAAGQAVAGVTVKSFTTASLVVTSPAGEEVTIEIGKQKKILLE